MRARYNFIKIVKVDLDSSCRELSNGGLGIAVDLLFFSGINLIHHIARKHHRPDHDITPSVTVIEAADVRPFFEFNHSVLFILLMESVKKIA